MAIKNEIGNKYGNLAVIERAENTKDGKARWLCKCDCGNTVIVIGKHLRSGNTKSCGCLRAQHLVNNLEGKKFGRLMVIERSEIRSNRGVVWKCQCDCGNIVEKVSADLLTGNVSSCGCLKRDLHSTMNDLTGQRFGKLVALDTLYTKNEQRVWRCVCDCGNETYVLAGNLRKGNSMSCGCASSHGNQYINQILKEKNITFDREKTFAECTSDTGNLLKFDFVLYYPNGEIYAIIEYNGIQHYQPIDFFGGQEGFESQIKRDNIKKEFCKNKQYQLYVIRYDEDINERMEGIINGIQC